MLTIFIGALAVTLMTAVVLIDVAQDELQDPYVYRLFWIATRNWLYRWPLRPLTIYRRCLVADRVMTLCGFHDPSPGSWIAKPRRSKWSK